MIARRILLMMLITGSAVAGLFWAPLFSGQAVTKLKTQTVTITAFRTMERDAPGEVAIELVQLPPGQIALASKDGPRQIYEIKPIWMSKYEVRWDEYLIYAFVLDRKNPWERRPEDADAESRPSKPYMQPYQEGLKIQGYPADGITFRAAQAYSVWLSKATGKKFRLPSEAEWEYACRTGGDQVRLDARALDEAAWFAANAHDERHPAGKKAPNAWGLYDMLGNVAEYVVRDPEDRRGLAAGGSFQDAAKDVHPEAREPYSPAWQRDDPQVPKGRSWLSNGHHVGFRVVMDE